MNIQSAGLFAALAALAAPAWAAQDPIGDLATEAGVSERHVRMILGNRTPYAEYPYVYPRVLKKFRAGVGEANYQRLISGPPVMLPGGKEVHLQRVAAN